MFDFLKKKIGGFIDGLTGREEKKEGAGVPEEKAPPRESEPVEIPKPAEEPVPAIVERILPEKARRQEPARKQKPETPKPETPEREAPQPSRQPEPLRLPPEPAAPPKPAAIPVQNIPIQKEEKGEERPRITLTAVTALKSFITREVEITESDVKGLLDDLELELLEADVEMSVAEGISAELRGKLTGAKVRKDGLHAFIAATIRETLTDMLASERMFTIPEKVGALEKPVKIMFIGVNGSGKTTTIAKVARLLMDNGRKVVFAAADTFRAAAIEQMAVHADRLGVKMIKRDYGSDPTSVAYDAVNYARAHGVDAVLIDTAGRQDTNVSLLNEMKKMSRVIQPDIKIYVGESIAGNAIIGQISAFHREIGLDAVILTKMDCDAKGGTMLSINRATGVPIIYVGMGQGYGDLERFEPAKIAARIVE